MIEIPLNAVRRGRNPPAVALADEEDEWLLSYHWSIARRIRITYAQTNVQLPGGRRSILLMHRALLPDVRLIDHVNGNGLDNRRSNLRPASKAENAANTDAWGRGTSSHRGVYWSKLERKWVASIKIDRSTRRLGCFATEEEAARAYQRAAREAWGEFTRASS